MYYSRRLLLISYLSVGSLSVLMFLLAGPLVTLFGLSTAATEMAVEILRWFAVFNLAIYPIAFVLPNALRGAGDAKFTMVVSMISMWAFRIGCSYLFCRFSTSVCWASGWPCSWTGSYVPRFSSSVSCAAAGNPSG